VNGDDRVPDAFSRAAGYGSTLCRTKGWHLRHWQVTNFQINLKTRFYLVLAQLDNKWGILWYNY